MKNYTDYTETSGMSIMDEYYPEKPLSEKEADELSNLLDKLRG